MTSSLVGSEMCIRDRHKRKQNNKNVRGQSSPHPKRQEEKHVVGGAETAVSYTHLTLPTICSV
eukprot:2088456-Prorocentrum_lima.AAC.1